jgi:predicted metal-dependent phosphoesterase TrpH
VKAGLCKSLEEAFDRFLKLNRPAWVPKCKISAMEGIELIHDAGGVAVMAHPGLNKTDEVIPKMVEAGLDGIECFHTKHTPSTSQHYLQIAKKHSLLVTGGSDCHGLSKGKPLVGTVKLPYQHVERLREKSAERKARRAPASAAAP